MNDEKGAASPASLDCLCRHGESDHQWTGGGLTLTASCHAALPRRGDEARVRKCGCHRFRPSEPLDPADREAYIARLEAALLEYGGNRCDGCNLVGPDDTGKYGEDCWLCEACFAALEASS